MTEIKKAPKSFCLMVKTESPIRIPETIVGDMIGVPIVRQNKLNPVLWEALKPDYAQFGVIEYAPCKSRGAGIRRWHLYYGTKK
tara:strand:+ start:580 stop:831 length:252 start_codon:yes stop_codon:yes gene_type:complete